MSNSQKVIDKLTPEQEAKFPEYRETYTAIGTNTDKIDFEKAKEAVIGLLKATDHEIPKNWEYATSPKKVHKKSDIVTYGFNEAYWVAFYKFFYDEFGVGEKILAMEPVVRECGWVYYEEKTDTIYLTERPNTIKMDDRNRLHSESGPAIGYDDGFSVYMWHGTRIPPEWIEKPETLTAKIALTHENVELRRCACEILGWATILKQLNAVVIDEDGDPEIGTLVEANIPDIGKEKFLRVLCGTKREFALPVPPEMKTAIEAQAWMLGLNVEDFQKPEVRT